MRLSQQGWLLGAWSLIMAASVAAALREPPVTSGSGPVIARLAARQGSVQFRQEGATLWQDAGTRQMFHDGTLLATGHDAKAKVRFRDGRELILDQSSQVILTLTDPRGSDSIVTLIKGSLHSPASRPGRSSSKGRAAHAPRPLIIYSGDKSVTLAAHQDGVRISKMIDDSTPVVSLLSGSPVIAAPIWPVKAPPPSLQPAKLLDSGIAKETSPDKAIQAASADHAAVDADGDSLASTPQGTSPEASPKAEAAVIADKDAAAPQMKQNLLTQVSPHIVAPRAGTRLWTDASLAKRQASALTVTLERPGPVTHIKNGKGGTPALDLLTWGRTARTLKARPSGRHHVVSLDAATLATHGTQGAQTGFWTLDLRPRLMSPEPTANSVRSPKGHKIHVASLADFPPGPVQVYLETIRPTPGSGWFAESGQLSPDRARAGIHLSDARDLPLLAPLLRSGSAFTITRHDNGTGPEGTYILKNGMVRARVWPDEDGASRWLRRALNADLAFRGPPENWIAMASQWSANAHGSTSETVVAYAPTGHHGLIRTALLKSQPEARQLLAARGYALFRAPITLVDPPAISEAASAAAPSIAALQSLKAPMAPDLARRVGLPVRVAFIDGLTPNGAPRFRRIEHHRFNRLGLVTTVDASLSNFTLSLNPQARAASRDAATLVREAQRLSHADLYVWSPDRAPRWQLLELDTNGRLRQRAVAAAPTERNNAAVLHQWLLKTLGAEQQLLLTHGLSGVVWLGAHPARVGDQAVVLHDGKAAGIVELAARAGGLGAVRVIAGTSSSLPQSGRLAWGPNETTK